MGGTYSDISGRPIIPSPKKPPFDNPSSDTAASAAATNQGSENRCTGDVGADCRARIRAYRGRWRQPAGRIAEMLLAERLQIPPSGSKLRHEAHTWMLVRAAIMTSMRAGNAIP